MVSYERQRLRELESLLPDIDAADKKALPQTTRPIRPDFVPKLAEDVKPPSVMPSLPTAAQGPPLGTAASFRPPSAAPALPTKSPISTPLPPQSPGAGPSTPTSPLPAPMGATQGPPLGGRFMDGSKSMFITPPAALAQPGRMEAPRTAPVTASSSPSPSPAPAPKTAVPSLLAGTPSVYHETDPLGPLGPMAQVRRTVISSSFASLDAGATSSVGHAIHVNSVAQQEEVDPLGLGKPKYMSQSMHITPKPQRPRLDAREAASKLANMF